MRAIRSILWVAAAGHGQARNRPAAGGACSDGARPGAAARTPATSAVAAIPAPAKPIPFSRGVRGFRHLSAGLQGIRRRMLAHGTVSYHDLQLLADANDGLAAFFLAQRIEAANKSELAAAAIHYYAMAAFDGRASAVRPLIALLNQYGGQLPAATLKQASDGLNAQADHNNALAANSLVHFYGDNPIFGDEPTAVKRLLAKAAGAGDGNAALNLSIILMGADQSPPVTGLAPSARADALRYLQVAEAYGDLGTRTIAENLMRQLGFDPTTTAAKDTSQ